MTAIECVTVTSCDGKLVKVKDTQVIPKSKMMLVLAEGIPHFLSFL